MSSELLQNLAKAVEPIPDSRSKQGVTHPYHGMIVLVLLGLIKASNIEIGKGKDRQSLAFSHQDSRYEVR